MECFVGCGVVQVRSRASAKTRVSAGRVVSSKKSQGCQLSMKQDDYEDWKTPFAGGFPGGEAFYKKWVDGGTKGKVPSLEDDKQPNAPNVKPTIYVEQMISNRGQQKGVDPKWKTEFAGGFPGGEVMYKKWIEEGTLGDVPDLDEDLQPRNGSK